MMTPEQLAAIQARFPHKDIPLYPMNVKLDAEGREQANYIDMRMIEQEETLEYAYEIVSHRADIPALLDEVRRLQGQVEALASLVKEAYRQGGYREKNDPPKGRETYEDAFYYSEARLRLNAILNGAESEGGHGN